MATIEIANLSGLRFQTKSPLLKPSSRSGSSTLIPVGGRRSIPHHHLHACSRRLGLLKCSLVDQQEQEQVVEEASVSGFSKVETVLIDALIGIQGRSRSASPRQLQDVERAVQVLEGLKGVPDPTSSSLIEGRWQLMFTTRPGAASPIQPIFSANMPRTFVGVDFFTVFQEIFPRTNDPRVSNIVKFSDAVRELKVEGTTFVLQKETDLRQKLLSLISTGTEVRKAIDEFISSNESAAKSELELLEGEWQMIWSSQVETDSWIENAGNGLMGMQIVKPDGQLKFLVDILLGFKFSMTGKYVKSGTNTYEVTMDDAAILVGPYGLPVEMETKITMELLYADEKIRISRGYNKILFVHVRVDGPSRK